MKTCYLIFLLLLASFIGVGECHGQRVTYSNAARDSVQIDFGLLDIYGRSYKIHDVQLYSRETQYRILNRSTDGNVNVIIPKELLNKQHQTILRIIHKTDRAQNVVFELTGRTICEGICCFVVIQAKRRMLDFQEPAGIKTVLYDEIEKGTYCNTILN